MWIPALDPHPVCISCLGVNHAPRFEATQKSTEAVKSFLPRREGISRPTAQAPTMATHHVRVRRRGAPHPQRQQQQQQQQQRPPGQQRDIYPPRQDRQSRRGWKRGRERSASRPAPTGQPQARLLGRSREVGEPFPKRARILQSDSSCAVALLYPQALVNKPPPPGGGFACGSPRPPSHAGSPSMVLSAQGQTQARSGGSEMLESSGPRMAEEPVICISPEGLDTGGLREGEERQTQDYPDSPSLARSDMVSGANGSTAWRAVEAPGPQRLLSQADMAIWHPAPERWQLAAWPLRG
ncbi:protein enabled-like isoform X2 [Alosa alosa]|uniref:protein enabled-like isoform X1 n=1 Tax=Alosa alosa TaxID=278164 RepID=UPI0020154072|nr:protein enabled-like isoform X1 [Alosa alosa]XP_048085439.1 protein enabled-like isoform X2 [Alosa alosa]